MPNTPEADSGGRKRSQSLRPLAEVNSEPAEKALIRVVWLLNGVLKRVTKRDWHGQEKIPRTGGVVFVVNHISNIDPIVFGQFLAYAGRWPRYLGKSSLFKVPIVGRIITACGQIPVERGTHNAGRALAAAIEAVEAGKSVTIYPEGTITFDPDLWPMVGKTGAARVAMETGCPVIPVGQWGAQHIMGAKQMHFPKFFPRTTLQIKAGDPVDLDDLRGQPVTPAVLKVATERIMRALATLVGELRGEEPPAEPFDPRASRASGDSG
jgi:1-acyl-sn-glycerol-3-phosphate acyltransferase